MPASKRVSSKKVESDPPKPDKAGAGDARARRSALRDLPPGSKVHEIFLVQHVEARKARSSGTSYLALTLRDAAGPLEARMFDVEAGAAADFVPGEPVRCLGKMERYHRAAQLVIESYRKPNADKVDPRELHAASEHEPTTLLDEIKRILSTLQDPHLIELRDAYFEDEPFMRRFQRAPASLATHHAWQHGLLEHVAAALKLAETLCEHYAFLERDLVLIGVFLHDTGKAFAFDEQGGGGHDASTAGRLLGPVGLGLSYLERKLQQLGSVPPPLALKLRHNLVSHPGQTNWGAIKPPMTPEAILIHHIDALDSVMGAFAELQAGQAAAADKDGDDAIAASAFRYSGLLRHHVYLERDGGDGAFDGDGRPGDKAS